MSYVADYNGKLNVKRDIPASVKYEFLGVFPGSEFRSDEVIVFGCENYWEDDVARVTNCIAPYISSGTIDYIGEDHSFWRIVFEDGEAHLEDGYVLYRRVQA